MVLGKIGEQQRCLKRGPKPQLKPELIKGHDVSPIRVPDLDADEKDIVPEKDVGFISPKQPHSKLPILEKSKSDEMPKLTVDILTKVVGLETLYGVLMEEHLGLQLCLQETTRRLRNEERRSKELEEKRNPINVALAERIGQLESEAEDLRRTVSELREENDHLEFRLLEMDELPIKKTVFRNSETRYDSTDIDDVSDSGVMSLPASDDEHQDFTMEAKSEGDVKSRLQSLSQSCGVAERICLQQGLALLRHYEARIEALESTIAAMCSEATLSRNLQSEEIRGSSRIIATVLPFTERKDCLQESGIFEESELASRGTQTEPRAEHGDLSTELEKLSRIREKIETGTLQPEVPPLKQLAYYRERAETLESRLAVYEAKPDEMTRLLRTRVEKEARLEAEVRHLRDRIAKLELENRALEEERCELEEAENDTRLRCQKLELKLSAVGEKKNCLKAQLEQLSREMAAREEEHKQASQMESLVKNYERKNKELEEREMEVRYRLQMLENTMPALLMWNMWRMMVAMQQQSQTAPIAGIPPAHPAHAGVPVVPGVPTGPMNPKEEELILKLQALEARLNAENKMLQESRNAEEALRNKVHDLEIILDNKDTNIIKILDRDPGQDIEAFEKMTKMAKERIEMKRRIKDLELKEHMYQETLQEFDGMFSNLEGNYSKQLKEKEDALSDKEAKLAETEHKLNQSKKVSAENAQLHEKLLQLEQEMKVLTEALKKREVERDALEREERKLNQELQECLAELENLKKQVEGPMLGQLEIQKKKGMQLEQELEKMRDEKFDMEADRKAEVSTLKNRINQLTRDIMESDVTIGELREEVQTLELAIDDLRYVVSLERANKEELRKEFEAKLEEKDRLLEELSNSMNQESEGKSLREELDEMMLDSADSLSANDFQKIEEIDNEISVAKKKISGNQKVDEDFSTPIASDSEDYTTSSKVPEIGESDVGSINSKLRNFYESGFINENIQLKTKTAQGIQELITEIDNGESLLDLEASRAALTDLPLLSTSLPRDCQVAQEAVTNSTGRDIKGTVDNLTKAFQHSKKCKKCNETLGSFLGDLIKELGVRLPSVQPCDPDRKSEYAGEPSTLKSTNVGAGTVGWDAKKNKQGYILKPTVSTLALTVENLQEKCRIKDAMIQAMADEFKHLTKCENWNGAHLMSTVADFNVPTAKFDFDRRTLCNYLNTNKPNDFYPEDEDVMYDATNPLGLRIVRQVGPDSILIEWNQPPPGKVNCFEVYVNGMFLLRVRSPGRTKALLHPIDMSEKLFITLNAVAYTGEPYEGVTIPYPS
nr:intracellular protein transport protein USO1-like isoform X3 [Halyomorpha halys]